MADYSLLPSQADSGAPHVRQVPRSAETRHVCSISAHTSNVVDNLVFGFNDGTKTVFGRAGGQLHQRVAHLAPGEVIASLQQCPSRASGSLGARVALTTSYGRTVQFKGISTLTATVSTGVSSALRHGLSALPAERAACGGADEHSVHAPAGHAIVGLTPIKGSIAVVWVAPVPSTPHTPPPLSQPPPLWDAPTAQAAFARAAAAHEALHAVVTLRNSASPSWDLQCFAVPSQASALAAAWSDAKHSLRSVADAALHVDTATWGLVRHRISDRLSTDEAAQARRQALHCAQGGGLLHVRAAQPSTWRRLKDALVFLSMLGGTRTEVFLVALLALLSMLAASVSSSSRLIVGQVIGLVTSASDDEMQRGVAEDWAAQAVCWTPVDCDRRGGLQAALLGSYFLLRLLGGALSLVRQRVAGEARRARAHRLDSWLLHHLLHLPVAQFTSPDGADFASRLSSAGVVSATWTLPQLGFIACRAGIVLWYLFAASPWMALTALLGVLLSNFLAALLQQQRAGLLGVLVAQKLQYGAVFLDLMRNMRLVASCGASTRCAHRADSLAQSVDSVQGRELVLDTASGGVQLASRHLVTCLALLVGVWWPATSVAPGDSSALAAALASSFLLLEDFMQLAGGAAEGLDALKAALPTLERFKDVATVSFGTEVQSMQGGVEIVSRGGSASDAPRILADESDCSSDEEEGGVGLAGGVSPTLHLRDVSATHPSAPWRVAVRGCTVAAAPGRPGALLLQGTGAGAECLLDVVMGHCGVQAGTVELGGVAVARWGARALRRAVAVVRAAPPLLDGSVLHNVLLGCPSRHHAALAQVLAAALEDPHLQEYKGGTGGLKQHAVDLVQSSALVGAFVQWVGGLPGGLHTQVGQGGVSLGMGERQLLSITRALLQRPRVLVLDLTACALGDEGVRALRKDMAAGEALARSSVLVLLSSQGLADELSLQTIALPGNSA